MSQSHKASKRESEDSKPLWEQADQRLSKLEETGHETGADSIHELSPASRKERDQGGSDHTQSFRRGELMKTYQSSLILLDSMMNLTYQLSQEARLTMTTGEQSNPKNQELQYLVKKSDQNRTSLLKIARRLRKAGRQLGLDSSSPAKRGLVPPRASEAIADERLRSMSPRVAKEVIG